MRGVAPAAELALLLASARAVRARQADRVRALAGAADPEAVTGFLAAHRVLAPLALRLRELAPGALDPASTRLVDDHVVQMRTRGTLHAMATDQVLAALAEDGIRAVALKGATLSTRLFGEPGMRESEDIDVLVAPGDLERAAAAVARLGWTRRRELITGPRPGIPRLHVVVEHEAEGMPRLELHWRVAWHETRFSHEALQRARQAGHRFELQPADELATLLLVYARDGFAGLKLALDVSAWWDRFGESLPRDGIAALRTRHPRLAPSLGAAALASERLVGVPARRVLGGPERGSRAESAAARLANWDLSGSPQQLSATITLVDGLVSFPGDARGYARRALFPPAPVVRRYYDLPAHARVRTTLWRAAHPLKLLGRYAVAVGRLRRYGAWSPASRSTTSTSPRSRSA